MINVTPADRGHKTHRAERKAGHLTAVLLLFSVSPLSAQSPQNHVKAEILSEVRSVRPGEPFWVAVRLSMDEGWHTYWMNPGDSGLPTRVEWALPKGFDSGDIQWPYPHRFVSSEIVGFGYENEVCLLAEIRPPKALVPGMPVKLAATVEWLECSDVCLPGKADLSLDLPVSRAIAELEGRWAGKFKDSRENIPISHSDWKISARGTEAGYTVHLTPPPGLRGDSLFFFFPGKSGIIDHPRPQEVEVNQNGYVLKLARSPYAIGPPARLEGVLVSASGWRGPGSRRALRLDLPVQYGLKVE